MVLELYGEESFIRMRPARISTSIYSANEYIKQFCK